MMSNQDKIQLWLQNEAVMGRKSGYEELSESEANILVQRFATDVDQQREEPNRCDISMERLEMAEGFKLTIQTQAGIEIRFTSKKY